MIESEATTQSSGTCPKNRSRTISNLTEEQIQHKRNVDRRGQRAFRQRTKDCIANLEQQHAQLKETMRQKESEWQQEVQELRAHNQALLRCLDNIVDLASMSINAGGHQHHEGVGASDDTDPPKVEVDTEYASSIDAAITDAGIGAARSEHGHRVASAEPHEAIHTGHDQNHSSPYGMEGLDSAYAEHAESPLPPIEASHSLPQESEHFQPILSPGDDRQQPPIDPRLGMLTPTSSTTMDARPYNSHKSVCAVLPSHLPPTCPLDKILLDFLSTHRAMVADGMHVENVVGPEKPTAKMFIYPELASSVHGLSRVMSEILSTFPYTMRWQISTTRENYIAMPSWLRPTATQIAVPHAAWLDNIPWPGVRDILIESPEEYTFEVFSEYYSQNVTINWQYDGMDAISDLSGEAVLHSIFEKHICNLKNWTVSNEFKIRFPNMVPAVYGRD
ncbi:hypothetical protein K402DRAFT_413822 [Aulographum hederae CBS 113979]|uniref:BZIP domain-containing protein n=1 Tax=Aulographum hederae CBS 113979 TaxID=1176131 RepID=A0A6G1GUI9_9PEZI|nr:hypothetical protein K402DRAFT_413822 [Aulographum hederae CBS 113979]